MTEAGAPARDTGFVQSLERGLAVVRALSAPEPQTLSDVARTTGLTRASARRFLLTLERLGYVRAEHGRFALTPQVRRSCASACCRRCARRPPRSSATWRWRAAEPFGLLRSVRRSARERLRSRPHADAGTYDSPARRATGQHRPSIRGGAGDGPPALRARDDRAALALQGLQSGPREDAPTRGTRVAECVLRRLDVSFVVEVDLEVVRRGRRSTVDTA